MSTLAVSLRTALERAVLSARAAAAAGAKAALTALAVERAEAFPTFTADQKQLRNALRARARQLGDGLQSAGFEPLVEEIAYHHWHRLVFARFLAENSLLMHPQGVPVTLADCAELAREEGDADAWATAARYAAAMLRGIFCPDDPVSRLRFAPEHRQRLEEILTGLPAPVFSADDSLGWMYQFWQSQKKAEINASGRKIGGADLAPVTQLFTEDYMVRFLLENSLGAWWAARHPDSPLLKEFTYLRFTENAPHPPSPSPSPETAGDFASGEGEIPPLRFTERGLGGEVPARGPTAEVRVPAAGAFPGWPNRAAQITVMDPCCGSGHFLVVAFHYLRRMRMEEQGLGEAEAADAVLRDNLFGLELDPRCTQIAAFALGLAAWQCGGYRSLPPLNIACSGLPVAGQLEAWTRLARDDANLRAALERLHQLFQDAPHLGSLINPAAVPLRERMFAPDYARVEPLLARALAKGGNGDDPAALFSTAAHDAARAARLLAGRYTLVATNVPYLARGKQADVLRDFCQAHHPRAKADLATAFLERCLAFAAPGGTAALVTPQNWLFLGTYQRLREQMLRLHTWCTIARLGPGAFETIGGEVVNVALQILTRSDPAADNNLAGLDTNVPRVPAEKAALLRQAPLQVVSQFAQLENPDSVIKFDVAANKHYLRDVAKVLQGIGTADANRYIIKFWEMPRVFKIWDLYQMAPQSDSEVSGCTSLLRWENGKGSLASSAQARICGHPASGKRGVVVAVTHGLYRSFYLGSKFDCTAAAIIPNDPEHLNAIGRYVFNNEFRGKVREVDQALSVTESSFGKVPFDLAHWQKVAAEKYPDGLPEPESDDPTQWLFHGRPEHSAAPLQVAVARLLGYRWPAELDDTMRLSRRARDMVRRCDELLPFAVEDGIACLPAVAGQPPAAQRLRALLAAAYEQDWSPAREATLLGAVDGGHDLAVWLRDAFFGQHCRLFHNRPFIWHIWDGRKDGFSALVNYHLLDAARLEKLIYTYLGDWLRQQRDRAAHDEPGAEGRLVAAQALQQKLQAIHTGEPPYDIYVRWKPLHQQPIGWQPDLNDGVRLNIRPFVRAGVLRSKFTINWNKDRGTNPDGSERLNDLHLTLVEKQAARAAQSLSPDASSGGPYQSSLPPDL